MATEDFAKSGTNIFLTGVAYTDATSRRQLLHRRRRPRRRDTITAVRSGDNATFTTTTWSSRRLQPAPAGRHVHRHGAPAARWAAPITHNNVVVGTREREARLPPGHGRDAVRDRHQRAARGHRHRGPRRRVAHASPAGRSPSRATARSSSSPLSTITSIAVFLWGDNDTLVVGAGVMGLYCDGGMGND